ncbi:MAG TPA: hypothetical protein VID68_11990 [Solirubrobacteraceae bacterium]
MPFTLRNLREDLEDVGSGFDGAADLEVRAATYELEREIVVSGSGRMKLDEEIVSGDAVRVPPGGPRRAARRGRVAVNRAADGVGGRFPQR